MARRNTRSGLVFALALGSAYRLLRAPYIEAGERSRLRALRRYQQGIVPRPTAEKPQPSRARVYKRDEAIFPRTYIDREGNILDGGAHYQIRGRMDMPAVWWSVTLYDEEFAFIPNSVGRHSLTSFNTIPEKDGCSFVIDISPERPEGAVNWLPSKRRETFNIVWRLYLPNMRILDDPEEFELPEVVCVES